MTALLTREMDLRPASSGSVNGSESSELIGGVASASGSINAVGVVSGSYSWKQAPGGPPSVLTREELRLDVDGHFPQDLVSGTAFAGLTQRVHWIARLQPTTAPAPAGWTGPIIYKHGDTALLPQTNVTVQRTIQGIRVTFTGGAATARDYKLVSRSFRDVEFEFDCVTGVTPITKVSTGGHPDRPADLPDESLSIEEIYRRSGFHVARTNGDSVVPLSGSGADQIWTDAEMHDAMQTHWSRFENRAQWSLWTFFANRHIDGPGLGGIMFDDIGPNHRQGTALFVNSFISEPPAGDPNPQAWVDRMVFWTVIHEMGHAFNLAHAWQKHLGTPWIPLSSDPETRSFMNYPFRVAGGVPAFFRSFRYAFNNEELTFLRHAPEEFVQMGNAAWFDNHGFEQADQDEAAQIRIELRINREKALFEFLEPVVLELKLSNVSDEPVLIDDSLLRSVDQMTIVVKRQGGASTEFHPFAHHCRRPRKTVLSPGESVYESIFLSAGLGGWLIADPGSYLIQACLHLNDQDLVTNAIQLRVLPAEARDAEILAQDYFSGPVARVLTFDGSLYLQKANDTLEELVARFPTSNAATHANIALAMPRLRPFKTLNLADGDRAATLDRRPRGAVTEVKEDAKAIERINAALGETTEASAQAAETLGHADFRSYGERLTDTFADDGDLSQAVNNQKRVLETLQRRKVHGRKVADHVLRRVRARLSQLETDDQEDSRGSRGRGKR